jgi:hypothetical protein
MFVMRPDADGWDCEAYGPDGRDVGSLCFIAGEGSRVCASQAECHQVIAAERQRQVRRINELAAAGDPVWADVADTVTRPRQLLGGEDPAGD